jgi:hypothetical protein
LIKQSALESIMVHALGHSERGAIHEVCWARLKATEFPSGPKETVVIVPIGSTEQHGPHLPVEVDSLLSAEVAARTAEIVIKTSVLQRQYAKRGIARSIALLSNVRLERCEQP